jgi:hypothetical protein
VIVKQESADEVECQAENRDRNRRAIFDINGMGQAPHRLVSDQQGDHSEDDGAAKSARSPSFPVPNENQSL